MSQILLQCGTIEDGTGRRANADRPLTHQLDLGERGLAMEATQYEDDEVWRFVVRDDRYQVSSHGRVYSEVTARYLKIGKSNTSGNYIVHRVTLASKDGSRPKSVTVASLVAEAFHGPRPDGYHVCHNDGDSGNNHYTNLRYGTRSDNAQDSLRHGTHVNAAKTHCPKGHPYEDDNVTTIVGADGYKRRNCRTCSSQHASRISKRLAEQLGLERSPTPENRRRKSGFWVRLTPEELGVLRAAAEARRVPLNELIRCSTLVEADSVLSDGDES